MVLNISTIAPAEAWCWPGNSARPTSMRRCSALCRLPPLVPCRFSPPPTRTRSIESDRFWKRWAPCGVDDASTAAALKLIANNSLAGAVLALRDSLRQADALGLSRAQALDVLELGQLGGLTARKRPFLAGQSAAGTADFTIGALAKDMALLAAASNTPLRSAADLADTPVDPESDIAVAATATMTLSHGADSFTDIFLLVRAHDTWRIANKAYHRHS